MINYIILEDEPLAYQETVRMISAARPDYRLAGWAATIDVAVDILQGCKPDLMIVDIRLADGLCFDVFERVRVDAPVIFTTAYDDYALQAFRVNSIDYLLKPIEEKDLERALVKFEAHRLPSLASDRCKGVETAYLENVKKNRFLVSVGDTYLYVETGDIAFFYSEDKYVYLHTFANRRYIVDYSLEQLEGMLDRRDFFRMSRNCIAHIKSVKKLSRYFSNRLRVSFSPECPHEVIVSRSRVSDCLRWMDGLQ